MAAAALCQKIIDKIQERFIITGLQSLQEITPGSSSDFYVSLAKKEKPGEEIAHINGQTYAAPILYIETIHRIGYGKNNTTKGAGLLLLDLVSCYAAQHNLEIRFVAIPGLVNNNIPGNTRLYNFYKHAGHKTDNIEKKGFGPRRKHFQTSANNIRTVLSNRYKGGRRTRRTRK
jgi:hypothetical protein